MNARLLVLSRSLVPSRTIVSWNLTPRFSKAARSAERPGRDPGAAFGVSMGAVRERHAGVVRRREVMISGFTHIGKEARDLDRRGEGTVHELAEVQNDYGDDAVNVQGPLRRVLAQLTPMERDSIAVAADVHPRTVERLIGPGGGRLR